jgi:hypothetical protein
MVSSNTPPASSAPSPTSFTYTIRAEFSYTDHKCLSSFPEVGLADMLRELKTDVFHILEGTLNLKSLLGVFSALGLIFHNFAGRKGF